MQSAPTKILIGLLILVILFHVGVLTRLIPYNLVGGGRLTSDRQMYLLEGISILVNGFLIVVLLIHKNFIRYRIPQRFSRFILGIFLVFFLLNTLGNLLAKTAVEQSFAILTLVFALLLLIILKSR